MIDPSEATREFHEFFKLPVRWQPTRLPEDELALRRKLIEEEYDELMEALDGDDLAHTYKEAADLIYVVFGWDQHAGNLLQQVFAEVHRSNMTKLWPCEACDGKGWIGTCYPENGSEPWGGMSCGVCHASGKVVKYREDGKVLKPPTYEPPNIAAIIGDVHDPR